MNVLIACEFSGTVRDEFIKLGHNAWSCDILPTRSPGPHFQADAIETIYKYSWDLIIAHPPCTRLTVTANKWYKPEYRHRFPNIERERLEAVEFFMKIANAPCGSMAIENPVGIMSTRWRKADQIIQPYEYGHNYSKKTCLWLKNLPLLKPTKIVEPEWLTFAGKRYSKHHHEATKLSAEERMLARSLTPLGIAQAMATQWGNFR